MIDPCISPRPSPGWLTRPPRRRASERFLANLGQRLIEDGAPLAGGALTLAAPHPLIARRTWLWRAESGEVIEALGFVAGALSAAGAAGPPGEAGRRWLAGLAAGLVHEDAVEPKPDGPSLSWIGPRPFAPDEASRLSEAARFAAGAARRPYGARHLDGGSRGLSRTAQRRAGAGGSIATRRRRDHPGGAALCRSARLHGALREQSPLVSHLGP